MREGVFPFFYRDLRVLFIKFNDYRKENDWVKSQISNLSVFSIESI